MDPCLLRGFLRDSKNSLTIQTRPLSEDYEVEATPFARGKFAAVRRCRHRTTGRELAAKCMRKRRRVDVRHEIIHEALVLSSTAKCPRIVSLHDLYETPSEIHLLMEMVPGGELQRVLDDEEYVGEEETARLIVQVLEALVYLHDKNIAHLDLKPQNILLTGDFPGCNLKLCDFGISRLIEKDAELREINGTPDYVAPEVLQYEPISLATDMWSVGVLAYVLLSGHTPFGGDSKQETFCNITEGHLDFPPDLFDTVSTQAKDFIRSLLKTDPSVRPTARECLKHPWLGPGSSSSPPQVQTDVSLVLSPISVSSTESNIHAEEDDTDPVVVPQVQKASSPEVQLPVLSPNSRKERIVPIVVQAGRSEVKSRLSGNLKPRREMDCLVSEFKEGLALGLGKRMIFKTQLRKIDVVY